MSALTFVLNGFQTELAWVILFSEYLQGEYFGAKRFGRSEKMIARHFPLQSSAFPQG